MAQVLGFVIGLVIVVGVGAFLLKLATWIVTRWTLPYREACVIVFFVILAGTVINVATRGAVRLVEGWLSVAFLAGGGLVQFFVTSAICGATIRHPHKLYRIGFGKGMLIMLLVTAMLAVPVGLLALLN